MSIFGRPFSSISTNKSMGVGRLDSFLMPNVGNDIKTVQAYYAELDKCVSTQTAWNRTMLEASPAAQKIIIDSNGMRVGIEELTQGLRAATIAEKAAELGMKALSIAGSMLATMLISMAFQAVITGLDNIAHASEHAKEALDDFHQKVKEGRDKLKEKYEFINSDEAKKLDELSKGVDAYGNSISLSTDQFNEYHSITNKVAEMFPAMVKGWDSQGNAILNNVDVLKQLNEEYKKAQDNHYSEIVGKTSDTVKNYNNYTTGALGGFLVGKQEEIDALEKYINGGFKGNDIMRDSGFLSAIKGIGLNLRDFRDLSGDISKQQRIIAQLQKLKNEQNAAFAPMKELLEAHVYTTKQGYDLTDEQSTIIDNFVNSFTYENSKGKTADELIARVNQFIIDIKNNPDLALSLDDFIKLDKESISEGDLNEAWATLEEKLRKAGFSDEIIMQIKLAFDVKDSTERDNKLKEIVGERADEIKQAFNSKELDLILNGDITVGDKSIDDLRKEIEEKMRANQPEVEVKLKARLEKLGGMSDAFKALKSAMDEVSDESKVTFSTIESLAEKLGDDVVEKYADTLLDASSSTEDLAKALRGMTQDYIEAKIASGEFNDSTEKEIASMLDEAGVANSTAVAHEIAAQAKMKATLATANLAEMTEYDYQAFLEEANAAGITTEAIESLKQKQLEAQRAMTSETVQAAATRIGIYKAEIDAIKTINDAFDLILAKGQVTPKYDDSGALVGVSVSDEGKAILNGAAKLEEYNAQLTNIQNSLSSNTTPTFKPSDKSTKDKSSKDKSKDTADKIKDINKQLDDLAKSEALQQLKYKFDDLERSINKISDALSILDNIMSMQADDDYIGKLMTTTAQIDLTQQKTALLRDEFTKLNAETPMSADMAQELATRMKSVADNIATNAKNMHDYAKNVAEYYTSALKSISSTQKATLDKADSLFERNVKSLTEGGLIGLDFRLSPTVPESAYENQRSENQTLEEEMQRYYDAVAAMQKTALDMQYQEQIADNARKREELNASLQDALNQQAEYSAATTTNQVITNEQIKAEQKMTNAETSAEQAQDDANKSAEAQNFSMQMETIINDLNNWMLENPVKAPGLDTAAWEGMVQQAKQYAQEIANAAASASSSSVDDFDFSDASGGSSAGQAIIDEAKKYIGTKYVWGGTTPDGFDCSGLVQYVFGKKGVKLSRTTYTQIKEGKNVSKDDLQPGDLVFFGEGSTPSHVGIYSGNGKFIHAPHTGDVVKYSDLNSSYYTSHYLGARRVLHGGAEFAKGTDTFDTYGKNPDGIVGENYKREVIINKKTGEKTVVDEPTLIDTDEYDIVGEKQTAVLDKNYKAKGEPPTDRELLDNIGKASIETGVPANIIMAVMDQESGYTWLRDENGKNGAVRGDTRVYGYMGKLTVYNNL